MIYDCFIFFNEIELLEIRLNVLNQYVDKFIILESNVTHQGQKKTLNFQQNKDKFSEFLNKIIYIIVDDMPAYDGTNSWELEHHQRNSILKAIKNCNKEDIIIISDIDEIPDLSAVQMNQLKDNTLYIFRQNMYYYYINCINCAKTLMQQKYKWSGSIMFKYSPHFTPQSMRKLSRKTQALFSEKSLHRIYWNIIIFIETHNNHIKLQFIENGGWHFSYLGGIDRIIQKIEAFAHTEYNKKEYKDPEKIKQAIENGKDIFGRNFNYQFVPLDNSFPEYIIKNKNKYAHLIKM